jgi:hypothetical protein
VISLTKEDVGGRFVAVDSAYLATGQGKPTTFVLRLHCGVLGLELGRARYIVVH